MPRPNPVRSLAEESNLARRIAYEREQRGWSYEGLAKRMTDAGCPINQSALYKVEKGDPPRRITVAELVALSRVFETPIDELLLPPELQASRELGELFIAWDGARNAEATAARATTDAWERLTEYVSSRSQLHEVLERIVGIWAEHSFPTGDKDEATRYWMWKITDSPEWRAAVMADIEREKAVHVQHQAQG